MIRWTPELKAAVAKGLDARAREIVGRTRKDLITRAAAFLLLSDSKSSFAIEGERPSSARAARWARAIGEAGVHPITVDELERLQRLVIGDARFVKLGPGKTADSWGCTTGTHTNPSPITSARGRRISETFLAASLNTMAVQSLVALILLPPPPPSRSDSCTSIRSSMATAGCIGG
jgi:hypothetical protein